MTMTTQNTSTHDYDNTIKHQLMTMTTQNTSTHDYGNTKNINS